MRAMKDSGIEWIGQIPQEWEIGRVKHIHDVTLGKMLQPAPKSDEDELCSYMCAANINWKGVDLSVEKKMWFSAKDKESYRLAAGDLLVTEGGDVAVSCIWNDELPECYIQNAVHRVRPKGDGNNRYLYYWLSTLKATGYIDLVCNKATLAHFTKDKFDSCIIPIISADEQHTIVRYLDVKCTEIDALIAAKEKTNVLLKERRQSIIYETVTKGLNPDAPMKDSGIEWIGQIPECWDVAALKRVATPSTGMTPSKANPQFWEGDIPWFSSKDIKADYLFDSEDHISQQAVEECGLTVHAENSVVFCARSGILRHTFPVSVLKCKGTINQDLRVLATSAAIDPEFLMYYLRGMNNTIVTLYQKVGATVESIEMEWLLYLPVALPPVEEQKQIADYIVARCNEIDGQIAANEVSVTKLKEYRQSIIYEAVTGKIEV